MTEDQFKALVELMQVIAWRHTSGSALISPALAIEDTCQYQKARQVLVKEFAK